MEEIILLGGLLLQFWISLRILFLITHFLLAIFTSIITTFTKTRYDEYCFYFCCCYYLILGRIFIIHHGVYSIFNESYYFGQLFQIE